MGRPLELQCRELRPPAVIIPIDGWNRVAENAVRFGLFLSDDVTAVHVSSDKNEMDELMEIWAKKVEKPAKAADSPFRALRSSIHHTGRSTSRFWIS